MFQMPGTVAFGIGEHGDRRGIAVPIPSVKEQHRQGQSFDVLP